VELPCQWTEVGAGGVVDPGAKVWLVENGCVEPTRVATVAKLNARGKRY